jgi:hypothetical protein
MTAAKRAVAGLIAAVLAVGVISPAASALPPGSAAAGVVKVLPLTGTAITTPIDITPPNGAACQGDSAKGGYRWQTFIASASVDAGTLTYGGGLGPNPVGTAVVSALVSNTSSVITDQTTSVGTNLVTGVPPFDFLLFPPGFFPNGVYNVGFACTLNNATTRFWQAPITVTNPGGTFTYSYGTVPAAPVLASPLTAGSGTLSGSFTQAVATPVVTGYTVTAVPTTGTTVTLPLAAGATTFALSGLTNGTSYSVTVKSTNTLGTSVASNAVSGTPAIGPQLPVTNLQGVASATSVALSWTAPADAVARTGYTISVSPTVAGAPFSAAPGATTSTVAGLAAGTTYTFTVTATYASPVTGTAATVQVAVPNPAPTPNYLALSPARLADTRPGGQTVDGLYQGEGSRAAGSTLQLTVAGRGRVDPAATAVALNVTVVGPLGNGFVTVFPCGEVQPKASNLNFTPGSVIPNAVVAKVGAAGQVCIFVSATTDLVVDVAGFFPPSTSLHSINPARALETRTDAGLTTVDGLQQGDGPRAAGSSTSLQIGGRATVPADASAVVLNVTVTNPQTAGFVAVYPCGTAVPTASNINYSVGDTVANLVVAKMGAGGAVCLFSSGPVDLIADINGYFPATTSYHSLDPARLLETRSGLKTFDSQFNAVGVRSANTITELTVVGRGGVPSDATTVVLNVTVTESAAAGFVTAYPCGIDPPTASNLNYGISSTTANAVIVKIGAGGKVCLLNSGPTHLIVDVNGYFAL